MVAHGVTLLALSHFIAQNFRNFQTREVKKIILEVKVKYFVKSSLHEVRFAPTWANKVKYFAH